jgi:hypothetical protein
MRIIVSLTTLLYFTSHTSCAFSYIGTKPILHQRTTQAASIPTTALFYNSNNGDEDKEMFNMDILRKRIGNLRLKIMEEDLLRPPNANLGPNEFVKALLKGIFYNEDPRPDSGFMLLLQCSTNKWSNKVLQSIGAPQNANLDMAASALGDAIGRPGNQYAILVGDNNDSEQDDPTFYVNFPGETMDFLDGTAWINVEFRSKSDNSLLVLTGWQLCQRPDGAWLVDHIDWQDYREKFRPGIGREEWMPFEGRRR